MLLFPSSEKEIYIEIAKTARQFSQKVIRPVAEGLDHDERFPSEIYKQMGDLGLFGITVPEEYGGVGFDNYAYAIIIEELSKGYASVADQYGLVELICTLLTNYCQRTSKKRIRKILKII